MRILEAHRRFDAVGARRAAREIVEIEGVEVQTIGIIEFVGQILAPQRDREALVERVGRPCIEEDIVGISARDLGRRGEHERSCSRLVTRVLAVGSERVEEIFAHILDVAAHLELVRTAVDQRDVDPRRRRPFGCVGELVAVDVERQACRIGRVDLVALIFAVEVADRGWFGTTYDAPYSWRFVSQGASKDLSTLKFGDTVDVSFRALNTGASTWQRDGANQVNVVTDRPLTRTSSFYDPSWINQTTSAKLAESSVAPGETGTFYFTLKSPNQAGNFKEYFSLVAQNAAFFNTDQGQYFDLNVHNPYRWTYNSQGAYTDSNKTTPVDISNMSPGQTAWMVVKANNIGEAAWVKAGSNRVDLATDRPLLRQSRFATSDWINNVTPAHLSEDTVNPGQVGTFEFPIQAPPGGGTYREYFNPVAQGITFFNNDPGQFFLITVKQDYRWTYNSQGAYTDSNKTTPVDISNMSPGQTAWMVVKANNIGSSTWYKDGNYQVDLATDRPLVRSSRFATGAWLNNATPAKLTETSVSPGQTGTFEFPVQVPAGAGTFKEYFNPVAQHITFFNSDPGQYFIFTVH